MSTSSAQISILQAMGVDVYQSYKEKPPLPAIAEKAWFSDLLSLLNINEDHCTFTDDSPISFEVTSQTLTLPLTIDSDDLALKRTIWKHIQDAVAK